MVNKKETFIGIADCHGIESFVPIAQAQPFILQIRADANRQRHALVYRIDVTERQKNIINQKLKKGEYKEALEWIKLHIDKVDISVGRENSWELIPNDKLDPWW